MTTTNIMLKNNKCESDVFSFWLLLYNFTTVLQMASVSIKRKQFLRIFAILHQIDGKFRKLKLNFTWKYVHAFALIIQIMSVVLLLILLLGFVRSRSVLLVINIFGVFSFMTREAYTGFFVVLTAVVYVRLHFLQMYIERSKNLRNNLVNVADILIKLTEVVENLNAVAGIGIVGKLAAFFFLVILFFLTLFEAKENCYLHFLLWLTFQGTSVCILFVFAETIQNKVRTSTWEFSNCSVCCRPKQLDAF